jgi:hypothetical protein
MTRIVTFFVGVLVMIPAAFRRPSPRHPTTAALWWLRRGGGRRRSTSNSNSGNVGIINGYCYAFATPPIHTRARNTNTVKVSVCSSLQQCESPLQRRKTDTNWMLSSCHRGGSSFSSSSTTLLYSSTKQQQSSSGGNSASSTFSNHAKESLSIAGRNNASLKSFAGLTYRDTFDGSEEEFRVLFVLGGPGKTMNQVVFLCFVSFSFFSEAKN